MRSARLGEEVVVFELETCRMAFVERGKGTAAPLFLLHAFPLNGGMWEPQLEGLGEENRRIIAPDYPGFGRSPHSPAQPDVHYYAEGVERLMDRLGFEEVVLGGISMGGYVAFECLRLFPEKVRGLVLANTRPDSDSEEARASRDEAIEHVANEGVEVLAKLQLERLLCRNTLQNKPEVVAAVKGMISKCSPEGAVGALSALRERPDSTPLLAKINVPTLVIGGEEDAIASPEVMGRMADRIEGSRHVVLEEAGHLSNLEAPREFNAALKDFLNETSG